jgi:hypothetical protein
VCRGQTFFCGDVPLGTQRVPGDKFVPWDTDVPYYTHYTPPATNMSGHQCVVCLCVWRGVGVALVWRWCGVGVALVWQKKTEHTALLCSKWCQYWVGELVILKSLQTVLFSSRVTSS